MRIVRPGPLIIDKRVQPDVRDTRVGREGWLREWLANQGKYCRLSCGCFEDLNDRSVATVHAYGKSVVYVWCQRCDNDSTIETSATFSQYYGLPPVKKVGDIPPF